MKCYQASREKSIKHGLDKGAVRGFLSGGSGISEEEATWGVREPNFRGDGDASGGANALCSHSGRGRVWGEGGGRGVGGMMVR